MDSSSLTEAKVASIKDEIMILHNDLQQRSMCYGLYLLLQSRGDTEYERNMRFNLALIMAEELRAQRFMKASIPKKVRRKQWVADRALPTSGEELNDLVMAIGESSGEMQQCQKCSSCSTST